MAEFVPDYLRVANDITRQIESGELQPDEQLPSIKDLADAHGVSKTTIKAAHTLLKDRGLIRTHPGKGVYVASHGKGHPD